MNLLRSLWTKMMKVFRRDLQKHNVEGHMALQLEI